MRLRIALAAIAIVFSGAIDRASAQATASSTRSGSQSFAQEPKPSAFRRLGIWTQSQLEAAKKQWAEDRQKFQACSIKLGDAKKKSRQRMSYHRQGHFLETCMRETP